MSKKLYSSLTIQLLLKLHFSDPTEHVQIFILHTFSIISTYKQSTSQYSTDSENLWNNRHSTLLKPLHEPMHEKIHCGTVLAYIACTFVTYYVYSIVSKHNSMNNMHHLPVH